MVKTASSSAVASLFDNLKNADVLGHPVVLSQETDWKHQPVPPLVGTAELERFVTTVLHEVGTGMWHPVNPLPKP